MRRPWPTEVLLCQINKNCLKCETSDCYSREIPFKSDPGHRLFIIGDFLVSVRFSGQVSADLCYNSFLPHHCPFINQNPVIPRFDMSTCYISEPSVAYKVPFYLHKIAAFWRKIYSLKRLSAYRINTFAASYLNTQGLNNSCLKSPASTLVDLTFQSRALRSFSLNQLRNLSL